MTTRSLLELSERKTSEWSEHELRTYHQALSDVSPWLNAQGNHLHHQVIDEISKRSESD